MKDYKWLTIKGTRHKDKPVITDKLIKGERVYGDNVNLNKYLDSIRQYRKEGVKGINGSIVMNCNPFTLGHRYLVEYAASQVETLYIFVVEEDSSYFPFKDRLELVKKGTEDIKNVVVFPSGNFIISAVTFPGYFYKDDMKDIKIDCSNDINVFVQYIAPTLNIKIRFAGEEPLDPITNLYNDSMKEILPKYGMEFRSIPRKKVENGDDVISASRVRLCLDKADFQEIKKFVPESTLNYLIEHYRNS